MMHAQDVVAAEALFEQTQKQFGVLATLVRDLITSIVSARPPEALLTFPEVNLCEKRSVFLRSLNSLSLLLELPVFLKQF